MTLFFKGTNIMKPYDILVPDYALICNSSRSKHKKARRNSGGIAIYAKLSLIKGLTKLPNEHSDIQWVKLNHKFFNLPKDIYLAFIYFSPENSSGQPKDIEEMYSKLLCNIENYSQYGEVLIQGDFNAYTSTTPDFVYSDESIYPHAEDDSYIYDIGTPRNNLDHKRPNKSGKLLIELCKEAGLRILNGRTIGDLLGKYTCIKYNGSSVVDYAVASANLLHVYAINSFTVHDFTTLSDHCAISCSLLTSFYDNTKTQQAYLKPLPGKFLWDSEAINRYSTLIQDKNTSTKLRKFLSTKYLNCNEAVNDLNTILQETALASAKFIKGRLKKQTNKPKRKPWFSGSCDDLYKTVKHYAFLINKFPFNGAYRKEYYSYRSKLRRKCKQEEKLYKNKICSDLSNNIKSDPKSFWDLLNKLKRASENNTTEKLDEQTFYNFFKNLNSCEAQPKDNKFHKTILKKLDELINALKNNNINMSYNQPITSDEIIKASKTLKNGKSKLKLPCKLFNIIHSMYDDTTCRIKFQNGLSEEFISNRGVKQGDVLSPLLFNLYINNLVKKSPRC
ncbi:unnamed protein product [Mytilus edulis]|uniref:Reverse transcriptase domain-containing protein n=1 Tax=Mytilus edulis TaxID=6550 RepID=A0A8S3PZD1_MYTED|nr:unnamed protein product [Mytilus edulis]